jgi:23S rRNA (adenine2503-C2)-methyltransferase
LRTLLDMSFSELGEYLAGLDQPRYRTGQIMRWLCRGAEINDMTDLPASLRETLARETITGLPVVADKLTSQRDGTIKLLLSLSDGELIESVIMDYEHGKSVCVSSEAGCRMGCWFCASTIGGLSRKLSPRRNAGTGYRRAARMRRTGGRRCHHGHRRAV